MKLIFHIGAGKTGSSSIQKTLRKNDSKLKKKGIWYLGMMLENAPVLIYNWQKNPIGAVVENFHQLPVVKAKKQLLDVLRPTIEYAKEKNYHTLIWSNESFFGREYNFVQALQELKKEGIEIEILIYVREYASWSQSAYIQWGLKHKVYNGEFQAFSEWIEHRAPLFYKGIHKLMMKFPGVVQVLNMTECKNVVLDFFDYIGITENNLEIFRDNDSPGNEELFLRSLYNSKFRTNVPIRIFNNTFGEKISFKKTPQKFLQEMFPDDDDLQKVQTETRKDRMQLNRLLVKQSQLPLKENKISSKSTEVDTDKIVMALCDMLIEQTKRIDNLEKKLRELKGVS